MKKVLSFNLVAVSLFVLLLLALAVSTQGALAADCEIPASGPWPACATGGAASNSSNAASNNSSSASCPIPASGPWPPCATNKAGGGATANAGATSAPAARPAATAAGTRTYSLQQTSTMMKAVMNESFTGNANCGGNQCFGNETTVTIENDTIRMVAFTIPSGSAANVKIDLLMRVYAENGEAKVTVIRMTRNRVVASTSEQLSSLSDRASGIFDAKLEAELGASAFDSINASNNSMSVSYR